MSYKDAVVRGLPARCRVHPREVETVTSRTVSSPCAIYPQRGGYRGGLPARKGKHPRPHARRTDARARGKRSQHESGQLEQSIHDDAETYWANWDDYLEELNCVEYWYQRTRTCGDWAYVYNFKYQRYQVTYFR